MTFELGRSLLLADAIAPDALASALMMVATKGVCLPRALVALEAVDSARLEEELARVEVPVLRHAAPLQELVDKLPVGLCDALMAVPLRRDARTGTVDVAVVDARDAHAADEIAYWLDAPVRVLRTTYAAMDAALRRLATGPERGFSSLAPPIWVPVGKRVRAVTETPVYGTPMLDEKAAEALLEARNIPIPLKRREPPNVSDALPPEFPTLNETLPEASADALPEPVHDLTTRKQPTSSRPARPSPMPPSSAARILAEEAPVSPVSPVSEAAPPTARGPFAATAPTAPFAEVTAVLDAMRDAPDRDHVIELLVEGVRPVARRVAIFVVKQGAFVGWACTPELGDIDTIRALRIPVGAKTLLARALDAPGPIIGEVDITAANVALVAAMRSPPSSLLLAAIRIDGRPALVVVADDLDDAAVATKRVGELSRAAAEALTRILRERRR